MEIRPLLPRIQFPTRILMVWTLVMLGIVVYSISWFALSPIVTNTLDALDDAYEFSGVQEVTLDLVGQVIYWNPLIAIFGWLLWGFLNSARRDVRTWEV